MIWIRERFPALAPAVAAWALLVGVAALQGCHSAEEGARPASGGSDSSPERAEQDSISNQVPGCWALRLTDRGARRDSLRAWLPAGSLPPIIELDTTRAEPRNGARVYDAYSWSDGRRRSQPFSVWRPMSADTIRVQRAGALAGTMLELGIADAGLAGNVIVFGDVGVGQPRRRRGGVEATAVDCPRR